MQWVYYIGGKGRKGQPIVVRIGVSADPKAQLEALNTVQPYELFLMAIEQGGLDLLEKRRKEFKAEVLRNDWYKASPKLLKIIETLPKHEVSEERDKKICLFFNASDFRAIEQGVDNIGTTTKARLIRRAVKFYLALGRYKAKGYRLQAIKGGRFVEFTDMDEIKDPDVLELEDKLNTVRRGPTDK